MSYCGRSQQWGVVQSMQLPVAVILILITRASGSTYVYKDKMK